MQVDPAFLVLHRKPIAEQKGEPLRIRSHDLRIATAFFPTRAPPPSMLPQFPAPPIRMRTERGPRISLPPPLPGHSAEPLIRRNKITVLGEYYSGFRNIFQMPRFSEIQDAGLAHTSPRLASPRLASHFVNERAYMPFCKFCSLSAASRRQVQVRSARPIRAAWFLRRLHRTRSNVLPRRPPRSFSHFRPPPMRCRMRCPMSARRVADKQLVGRSTTGS